MSSDEAVEAAADLIVQGDMGDCECRRSPYDKHDVNPPCSTRRRAIRVARAALEAAAPHMLIHVHHLDIEHHARSFNEGYEAAVTQGLADDPTLADDWFQEKIREAKAEAFEQGQKSGIRHASRLAAAIDIGRPDLPGPISANPYRSQA